MMQPIYQPNAKQIAASQMADFSRYCESQSGLSFPNYDALYAWSIESRDRFWSLLAEYVDIHWSKPYHQVLQNGDLMPGSHWFVGGELNYAEHCLRQPDDKIALIFRNELNEHRSMTYRSLRQQVADLSAKMRECGVVPGDRVAGFCPNLPETIIAFLASASIGAIWSSCSPDFGVQGVLDRFAQIQPKILFVADGQSYQGKLHSGLDKITAIVQGLPTVTQVIVIRYTNKMEFPAIIADRPCHRFDKFYKPNSKLEFTSLPFEHPLYILFSSGTTGAPKCIVHGTGGVLLQHLKELRLHSDLRQNSTLFFFTTCGWMMWNWMVSGLAVGSTLVLYDGAPMHPKSDILFDIIEEENVTHFGTSAKYLSACEKAEVIPNQSRQFSALNTIFSTGSPLLPEQYTYVYSKIKSELHLCSISGGTDIVSCFVLGNPMLPIYSGEIQCRGLGLAIEIYNEAGVQVRDMKGELVCTKSFPCMPIAFWNDPDGKLYHNAYFARFDGVWAHGDYAIITPHNGVIIYGRSDAVLNPGGVRIGTAEIYRQVEKIPEVIESLVVGQDWQDDVRIILFVVLREGLVLNNALKQTIAHVIRQHASPRHVPAKILQINEVPRTVSGKIVELTVKNIIHHKPVKNLEALANPNSLKQFYNLPELQE